MSCNIFVIDLPDGDDGDKVGLDDFLVANGQEAFSQLLEEATDIVPVDFESILNRINDDIASGGNSAVFRDAKLLDALAELSVDHSSAYGGIIEELKHKKLGLRTLQRTLKPRIGEILLERPATMARDGDTGGFFIEQGQICRMKITLDGPVTVPLCNFTANIISETVIDDGVERTRYFEIEGRLKTGQSLSRIEVRADKFHDLKWLADWKPFAIVWAGEEKMLPAAIQALSDRQALRRNRILAHTGWCQILGTWTYLHGGGAIGLSSNQRGEFHVSVRLPGPLENFEIESVQDSSTPEGTARAVLEMITQTSGELRDIMFVLVATVFRSAIRSADFSIHLVGPTGVFKSELAALAQQFFGRGFDSRHLPGSWSSTANSLEMMAFTLKDALFVIDDFAPVTSDAKRMHRDADRLFRNQGNNAARGRMNHDGTLRPDKPPRGLILSTGEDVPQGHSCRARSLILELQPGMIDTEQLSAWQENARAGIHCECMRVFLEWLSPRYDRYRDIWKNRVAVRRTEFENAGLHARTPDIAGELFCGFNTFLNFCRDAGALSQEQLDDLSGQCQDALVRVSQTQQAHQQDAEPADQFVSLIESLLTSGRAHFQSPSGDMPSLSGDMPASPGVFGWQLRSSGLEPRYEPRGACIGWVDDDGVYLDSETSYAEACKLANEQGSSIPVTKTTLWKRLAQKGHLAATYENRTKVQKVVLGKRKWVIHLMPSLIGQGVEAGSTTSIFDA